MTAGTLAPLPRAFYARPTELVARALLGKVLVRRLGRRTLRARIVEVEAYLGERDAASHARRGPTPRSMIMFGPPGFLYVYLVYGMHHCMNFVTESDGVAGAVLIRAAAPLDATEAPRPYSGPGKLCAGLGVTLADKGLDLTVGAGLFVADDGSPAPRVSKSARIGVDYAGAWKARLLRFYVAGDAHVSGQPR
ncbi:MAG TPA: DNA-3-methyladenine glycosylase [Polyangia bacterium]|jgi:DNA-3-methyladenine glycosylase|nr:DNA-3-methyladenine glycosylase [Polyangia bacterium]